MNCSYIIKRLRVENFYTQQQIADILNCKENLGAKKLSQTQIAA